MSRELKCARCGAVFTCQPENISACQCGTVSLPADLRIVIAARYDDCLCANCLRELAAQHHKTTEGSQHCDPSEAT